jgi:hypothetical protein
MCGNVGDLRGAIGTFDGLFFFGDGTEAWKNIDQKIKKYA